MHQASDTRLEVCTLVSFMYSFPSLCIFLITMKKQLPGDPGTARTESTVAVKADNSLPLITRESYFCLLMGPWQTFPGS